MSIQRHLMAHLHQSLFALIGEIAQEVRTGELDNLTSTSFIAEIEAMRHETLNTRIFAS